jgi:hypothetical protein
VESFSQRAADAAGRTGDEDRVASHLHDCLSRELEATATGENPGGGRLDKTADIQARANRTGGAS